MFWRLNLPMQKSARFFTAFAMMAYAHGNAHAGEVLRVFSCEGKTPVQAHFEVHQVDETVLRLIRKGQAVWASGRLDAYTVDAMAEGRGIWAVQPVHTLFEVAQTSVDARILAGIAHKESSYRGRYWPWTIHFQGRGFYLPDRASAIEAARYLIANGYTNFDTSLMQVNWRWHQHRFTSIEQAFDPIASVRVAAQILSVHFHATGSWHDAIARYHSRTTSKNQPYLSDVLRHMQALSVLPITEKSLC